MCGLARGDLARAPCELTHPRVSRMSHVRPKRRPGLPFARVLRAGSLLLLAASGACAGTARSEPSADSGTARAARGTLFIVGGGPQPDALVKQFVDLAGGPGKARIVVFAMASSEGLASGEEKAQDLRKLGADARNIYVKHDLADTDSIARLLDGVTGVWFGGGDQVLLTNALRGTRTERAIHERYAAGAVIGGTSAGAAVMSTPMITGEERRPGALRPPSDTSDHFLSIDRGNVITEPGFGFLTDVIIDQHFVRRRRHNRLMSLVIEGPVRLGVGIDESTALIVHPDGRWSVAGASAALVYDARHATVTAPGAGPLGAQGIVVHVLPAGSTYDPASGRATLPGASGEAPR